MAGAMSPAKPAATKVGVATKGGEAAPAKEEKERRYKPRNLATFNDGRNQAGKFTAMPTGWSSKDHKPLRRGDFADDALFLNWRAARADELAAKFTLQASTLRKEADDLTRFGDPEKRAKAKRAEKLRAKLAELEAQLVAEGIQV